MADYGIKISKPGQNVLTATNDKMAFSSKFNVPKTFASGASTLVVSGGTGSRTIAHGLPAIPIALVYMERVAGDGKRYLLNNSVLASNFGYTVDATNLKINVIGSPSNGTYNLYYYTFLDAL